METLPVELAEDILGRLDAQSVVNAACTCKWMHRVATNRAVWQKVLRSACHPFPIDSVYFHGGMRASVAIQSSLEVVRKWATYAWMVRLEVPAKWKAIDEALVKIKRDVTGTEQPSGMRPGLAWKDIVSRSPKNVPFELAVSTMIHNGTDNSTDYYGVVHPYFHLQPVEEWEIYPTGAMDDVLSIDSVDDLEVDQTMINDYKKTGNVPFMIIGLGAADYWETVLVNTCTGSLFFVIHNIPEYNPLGSMLDWLKQAEVELQHPPPDVRESLS